MIISIKYYIPFSVELFKIYIKYIALFMFFFFHQKQNFERMTTLKIAIGANTTTTQSHRFLSYRSKVRSKFVGGLVHTVIKEKVMMKASVAVVAIECHSRIWQMFYMMIFF